MADTYSESSQKANLKTRWARDDVSKKIIDFQNRKEKLNHSQRGFAKDSGVPRTTLQNWLKRLKRIDADPSTVSFFESPAGVNFLHILVQSLHFEFTKVGCYNGPHNLNQLLSDMASVKSRFKFRPEKEVHEKDLQWEIQSQSGA